MSINFSCDGCDTEVVKPEIVGFVVQRHYCRKCAEKATKFLEAEERIRLRFRKKFNDERAKLLSKFEGFKLPDV